MAKSVSFALPPIGTQCATCTELALRVMTTRTKETKAFCLDCSKTQLKIGGSFYQAGDTYILSTPPPAHPNAIEPDEQLIVEEAPEDANEGELSKITKIAERQKWIKLRIAEMLKELATLKAELKTNEEVDLPGALDAVNMKEFSLKSGETVERKVIVAASITKANKVIGHAALDEIGWGSLVKRTFVIPFNRDEEKLVRKFQADLQKRKVKLRVEIKTEVNSRSLAKTIRENDELATDDEEKIDLTTTVPGMTITYEKLFGVWRAHKAIVGVELPEDANDDSIPE